MAAEFLAGPRGDLEVLRLGSGEPVTLFAHGLGASIASTRPYASGLDGTKVFFHFASHGRSAQAFDGWNYDGLRAELLAVADAVAATRALGVSMGAGAILSALVADPHRFERVVLALPAVITEPRDSAGLLRYQTLADSAAAADAAAIREQLREELTPEAAASSAADAWLAQQAEAFVRPGISEALRHLPHLAPVSSLNALRSLSLPVLILAQEGDAVHPVRSAEILAGALPNAELKVVDSGGLLFAHRARVRQWVTSFLAE